MPGSEPTATRVLLVDDQELMRMAYRMVIDSQPDLSVVGEASTGRQAVEAAGRLRPAVVVMDVRMPEMDGVEATRRIVAADPAARVIILTTFDLDEYMYTALRAGASGFLLKDAQPTELLAAIRAVAGGGAIIAPTATRRLLTAYADRLTPGGPRDPADIAELKELTPRELDVLLEVAAGLSNAEIAEKLFLSEATVKSHVGRILSKLELRDRVQVVVFAYETGLVERTQA
jgi:DNA-binding NarL/FixJ family response regulator